MDGENPTLTTPFGTPVPTQDGSLTMRHPEHGECYHSTQGARFEAERLYIDASGFRDALATGVDLVVFDIGLGLGYNALATIRAWQRELSPGMLGLESFEVVPALVQALASGEAPWQTGWHEPELDAFKALTQVAPHTWQATIAHPTAPVTCQWRVHVGDAKSVLSAMPSSAGAPVMPSSAGASGIFRQATFIWQDPFSPAKNPTMWDAEWFAALRQLAAPDAQLVTYSVARAVRDALTAGGWQWEKIKAATELKKHWLRARPVFN
jgi:tRNA U34 5-methylaminomethyl-2-thiouridine-forming methyltransferase MnmC